MFEMLSTIVLIISIVGAGYSFVVWGGKAAKWLRRWRERLIIAERKIRISFIDKKICEDQEHLRKILHLHKRDVLLGKSSTLVFCAQEIALWEKQLRKINEAEQSSLASHISAQRNRLAILNSMLQFFYRPITLGILNIYTHDEEALPKIVRGMVEVLTECDVASDSTRFDVWFAGEPELHFGIYLDIAETRNLLDKTGFQDKMQIIGPGRLSAGSLPQEIILDHILPRLFLEIVSHERYLSKDLQSKILLLYNYHVGLG